MAFSFSKPVATLLLVAAALTAAAAAAGQDSCGGHKVTVQNLCGHDLRMDIEQLANSKLLYSPGWVLRNGQHAEFPVCAWTGRVKAPGAPVVEFHMGYDGGAWYQVSTDQSAMPVRVSVTPHARSPKEPLQGHCPTAGCSGGNHCFEHAVPGGNCHAVSEIKIVYYKP